MPYRAILVRSATISNCAAPDRTSTWRSAAPGTSFRTVWISPPSRSSTPASGPNTFTATSAFTPDTTSSRRMAIGWVKLNSTPGREPSASDIATIRSSLVRPLFQVSMGCRITYTSPW